MGKVTGIAWTDSSWSPWIGCTKVSPGCDHCYAEALDKRHRWKGDTHWGAGKPRMRTSAHYWKQPKIWNRVALDHGKRHRVFPSLCDPFDNEVPDAWRADFWNLIVETPHLTWLLLTKRISNAIKMLPYRSSADRIFDNVWIGASIVNQEEADRDIPRLMATPAFKRFISYEPALGPVNFEPWLRGWHSESAHDCDGTEESCHRRCPIEVQVQDERIDQIIVGGESDQGGAKARPFDVAWARSTIKQCRDAGVSCFIKQLGSRPVWHDEVTVSEFDANDSSGPVLLKDRAGADPAEWPEDLRVQAFPTRT